MTPCHQKPLPNFITFNCNYVFIKYFNHHFNFCVSKSFYYSTEDALLRKAFTNILNCCNIHFTYILFDMASLLNSCIFPWHLFFYIYKIWIFWGKKNVGEINELR